MAKKEKEIPVVDFRYKADASVPPTKKGLKPITLEGRHVIESGIEGEPPLVVF